MTARAHPFVHARKSCQQILSANLVNFIHQENEHEEGQDIAVDNLIEDAVAKHLARILSEKWSAPAKEEQGQILAFIAKVKKLSKAQSKNKRPSASLANGADKKTPKHGKTPAEWAWKDTTLKDGEPTTKNFKRQALPS